LFCLQLENNENMKILIYSFFTAFFLMSTDSCADETRMWLDISSDTIELIDDTFIKYKSERPGSRGVSDNPIAKYNVGDNISEEDQELILKMFRESGFANSLCKLYTCKEDVNTPCNPNLSECDCKCRLK